MNVYCKEAPGSVVFTGPAAEDEGDLDSLPETIDFGHRSFTVNERDHFSELKGRYRQRRDRTRQLVAPLSTLNSRTKLTATEGRLLTKKLPKDDIKKHSRFDTLATTLCDQEDALDETHRCYDAHVQSFSSQIAHLKRYHEARIEYEVHQAAVQVDVTNERLQACEAQAQLRLQEQAQMADMLISELRRKLKETVVQATANTHNAAQLEVQLRKVRLEAHHRLAELEPTWNMFIAKHNEEEKVREQEQRRRAAVAAQPSERRNRGLEDVSNRVDLRLLAIDSAADTSHLATPRGADNVMPSAHVPGSASTLGMILSVSIVKVIEIPTPLWPRTVDYYAARVTEFNSSISSGRVKDAHQEGTDSSSTTLLRREELITDDSMRKTTLANLETKIVKAFRNIFAHHKNADAKISDWVSYIPVELHTQVRAQIRSSVVNRRKTIKCGTSGQLAEYGCVNGTGCFNRAQHRSSS
jgi:hypothetical protein